MLQIRPTALILHQFDKDCSRVATALSLNEEIAARTPNLVRLPVHERRFSWREPDHDSKLAGRIRHSSVKLLLPSGGREQNAHQQSITRDMPLVSPESAQLLIITLSRP
jgi:hypothetical protein